MFNVPLIYSTTTTRTKTIFFLSWSISKHADLKNHFTLHVTLFNIIRRLWLQLIAIVSSCLRSDHWRLQGDHEKIQPTSSHEFQRGPRLCDSQLYCLPWKMFEWREFVHGSSYIIYRRSFIFWSCLMSQSGWCNLGERWGKNVRNWLHDDSRPKHTKTKR
jgi:hypothetical protein